MNIELSLVLVEVHITVLESKYVVLNFLISLFLSKMNQLRAEFI